VVRTATFSVDLAAKKVIRDDAQVHLTPTEWGILEQPARNRAWPNCAASWSLIPRTPSI
jgi:DNA-binding response OmpR family regulator